MSLLRFSLKIGMFMLFLVLPLGLQISKAQDDVPLLTYNDAYQYEFTEQGEQFFAQFDGKQGDVVYLVAKYTDFVIGTIELDLRDTVGRTVGFKGDYAFSPFVIADLPSDGKYTVVITVEEPGTADILVGQSGYLNSGIEANIQQNGFDVLALVKVEETGSYRITFQQEGDLGTSFNLVTFSEFFTENIITVDGTEINNWTAEVDLNSGDNYVVFFSRNLFSGDGSEAIVNAAMELVE